MPPRQDEVAAAEERVLEINYTGDERISDILDAVRDRPPSPYEIVHHAESKDQIRREVGPVSGPADLSTSAISSPNGLKVGPRLRQF